ncbi:hypothetical protein [Thalassotalea sp. SU-HH00458]|uniref:hypothetical protein n=1 Tax=Thalassotalea sp. SU-HH00458 TaxID=3127657 RepID=UPI0031083536
MNIGLANDTFKNGVLAVKVKRRINKIPVNVNRYQHLATLLITSNFEVAHYTGINRQAIVYIGFLCINFHQKKSFQFRDSTD